MAKSAIPLCSPFKESRIVWPALMSEKLDGVPIKFSYRQGSQGPIHWSDTRQGETFQSYQLLLKEFADWTFQFASHITAFDMVGELTHMEETAFKKVSGIVRRGEHNDGLMLNVFEGWVQNRYDSSVMETEPFSRRIFGIDGWIGNNAPYNTLPCWLRDRVRVIPQQKVRDIIELEAFVAQLPEGSEGAVLRNMRDLWEPGKRLPGYMRITNDPTIDLKVVRFEEAVSKNGEPKGMVGRIVVSYNGVEIGCGPGKLTHAERTELWDGYVRWMDLDMLGLAQIKYKEDPSYDALRQPTFQCWRPDKTIPDA